jgi:hypothetical protein
MRRSPLVLTIPMIFCLTFVVTALPQQRAPLVQPSISMDFAQYCVGDSWTFRLRSVLRSFSGYTSNHDLPPFSATNA